MHARLAKHSNMHFKKVVTKCMCNQQKRGH